MDKNLISIDNHVFIKPEYQNNQYVSGNKLWKLKYNLIEAKRQSKTTILTFGGAFSNHIAAVAYAGMKNGFKTSKIESILQQIQRFCTKILPKSR